MRNIKRLLTITLVGVLGFSLAGCNMIQKTPEAIQKTVVAKVGSEKITLGQVDDRMKSIIEQLKQQYGEDLSKNKDAKDTLTEQRKQYLDGMVTEKVFLKKAEELKLVPGKDELDKEVSKKFDDIKKVYQNDDQFNEALKSANFTTESLKSYLAEQVKIQKVMDYIFKDIKVTDADIEKYYNENKAQFTQQPGAQLGHILVKTEDEAKKIQDELNKGAKFEDLAAKYGTDGTKDKGGDLGFISYDDQNYDKDFMAAAKNLKEGEISGPVKSQFGWHIIKATNVQKEAKTKSLEEVKDQVKETLENNARDAAYKKNLDEWKKELKVETYENKL
ncbi:foldase protein PrsA [Clostridium polyendosporum]|uniref:peptidylprolyl isomerase n=1 Tax=Clostridium polyendosporum TaxID=69208 RepID=A0A919S1L7_9CLOT|nr:peptidylprolyl isomerase [Clostridium polyendosporum]GIM30189.1 foldase protein PrsA [Clostridium polyendosporum]